MATSPRRPEKWQQKQSKRSEATEVQNSPTQKAPKVATHSGTTTEQPRSVARPERVSEPRSTPSLPKTPAVSRPAPASGWGEESLPFEMDFEPDDESSSPTPR